MEDKLARHVEQDIFCDQCEASFSNKSAEKSLKDHKKARHDEQVVKCDRCDKSFTNNDAI